MDISGTTDLIVKDAFHTLWKHFTGRSVKKRWQEWHKYREPHEKSHRQCISSRRFLSAIKPNLRPSRENNSTETVKQLRDVRGRPWRWTRNALINPLGTGSPALRQGEPRRDGTVKLTKPPGHSWLKVLFLRFVWQRETCRSRPEATVRLCLSASSTSLVHVCSCPISPCPAGCRCQSLLHLRIGPGLSMRSVMLRKWDKGLSARGLMVVVPAARPARGHFGLCCSSSFSLLSYRESFSSGNRREKLLLS